MQVKSCGAHDEGNKTSTSRRPWWGGNIRRRVRSAVRKCVWLGEVVRATLFRRSRDRRRRREQRVTPPTEIGDERNKSAVPSLQRGWHTVVRVYFLCGCCGSLFLVFVQCYTPSACYCFFFPSCVSTTYSDLKWTI